MEDIPAITIRGQGAARLVEFVQNGKRERRVVPAEAVQDGAISPESLADGIPYGIPWAKLIELSATPELLEANLHAAGIWTLEDLSAPGGAQAAMGAIQKTYGLDLSNLIRLASQYQRHES